MSSKTSRLIHVHCAATVSDYVQVTITDDISALSTDVAVESTTMQLTNVPFRTRLLGCVYYLFFGHIYNKTNLTPASALLLADKLRTEAEGIIEMQLLRVDTELE